MNFLKWAGCIGIVLTMQLAVSSSGQEQSQGSNKSKQPKQLPPRFDTVQVLDRARRLSDDARSLKPLDEISLQARLADTVWDYDQSLAKRLLSRSFELTITLLKDSRVDPASDSADALMLFAHISVVAAKHDENLEKKLKERWQEAVASGAEKGNELKSDPAQMAYLLLGQSATYLKSDKQKARQLFRQSISFRVTQDHCFFLLDQRQHAPDITDTLFSDSLDVLAQRPLSDANELLMLSSYLFSPNGSITYVGVSGYNTANVTANMSAVPKNAALAKRYLGLLLAKVNGNELMPAAVAHFALKNLVPQYQLLAPELLNDVYAKMATLLSGVSQEDSSTFEAAHKNSNASESEKVADLEKRLEKADKLEKEDGRDFEYFNLLFGYLLPNEDFTRALLIVSKIGNQELKEKFGDLVNLAALQAKLRKPDTASVSESDLNKLKAPLVRVVGLSSLGQARMKQKATGDALRLFEQATGEANQIKDEQDRIQAKLMLVQLFLDADAAVGFDRAAKAFKEVNHFSDFNADESVLSLKATVYGLKNYLSITAPAPSSLWSAVAKMCQVNCEETFNTSGLLEKKETKLWATFVAVQIGLRESSKKANAGLH
ncbi:MAG TPA: hypothetical protein VF435_06560, partial [Pyrinomonadaceae bacterium]